MEVKDLTHHYPHKNHDHRWLRHHHAHQNPAVKTVGVKNIVTTIVTVAVGHLSKILAEQPAETVEIEQEPGKSLSF